MNKTKRTERNYLPRFRQGLIIVSIFIFLPLTLHAQSTRLSLSMKNVHLKEVIHEIEKKSEMRFSFKDADLDKLENVTINVTNKTVEEILGEVLPSRQLEFQRAGNTIAIVKAQSDQQTGKRKKITGVVYDENKQPIIGANISEKTTNTGAITDFDGKFVIEIPENSTFTVSYIGYTPQTVNTAGKTSHQITLQEDAKTLNEVVVVGYGIQKKKLVTGATVQVKGGDIQKLNTVSPVGALQSQSPGVNIVKSSGQPGADFKVTIRGVGTTGESSPLYIVDGVTVSGINHLSPSDIESIDVLKDAASAAIYGARAANGVILVTTKQGKAGKASIEYDGYYGIQNMIQNVRPLNAQEYAMIMNEGAANAGLAPYNFSSLVPDWTDIESGKFKGTNWLKEMTNKNAAMQNHALSVRGGTEQSVYSLGLSYTNQEGIFGKPASPTYSRYTFLANTEHKIIKKEKLDILKIGENLNYNYSERNTIGTGDIYNNDIHSAFVTNPFMPVYNANGDYHYALNWDDKQVNPMGLLYYTRSKNLTKSHQLTGNVYVELQPVSKLKFRSSFGINLNTNSYRRFIPIYDLGPQNFIVENVVTQQMGIQYKWIFENTVNYDFDIKDNNFNILVGTSAEKSGLGETIRGENVNMIFDDFDYAYLSNAKIIVDGKTMLTGDPGIENKLLSYFTRINYNLKETYMATLVMRADGSSNFSSGNRWGYFPSASAGWVISNENFMKNSSGWLDFLKLRVSWGQNGNQNIAGFQYLANIAFDTKYFYGTDKTVSTTGAYPSILANDKVKWETSEQINAGIDARFLKDRLSLTFDLYNKVTKDWLLVAPVLGSIGTGAPYINGGDVRNRGYEIGLNWSDQSGKLKYAVNANISYNQNKVIRIANSEGIIHGPANVISHGTSEMYRAQVGYPIGYFWGYKTDGLFQNVSDVQSYKNAAGNPIMPAAAPGDIRFVDMNNDGTINDNDKVMIGDPNPDYNFGLSFNCSYSGFDFSIVTNGVAGNQIVRSYRSAGLPLENYTSEILGRWRGEGTSNKIPRVMANSHINNSYVSDRYVENGDYLRISNVSLGYDFGRFLKPLHIKQARLYVSAQNLYTFTAYKGLDPEVGYGYQSSWASGIDLGFYPTPRVFMVGLSVKY